MTGVARADLDRHRLAGEQRRRRSPTCPPRRRRRSRSSRPAARRTASPTARSSIGTRTSCAVAENRDVVRAEVEQRAQRGARPALGPGLEVAAGEEEHGDGRRDLEVELVRAGARSIVKLRRRHAGCRRRPRRARRCSTRTRRGCRPRSSVSIVVAPWRRFIHAARWNGQPPQVTTGVVEHERDPLPVGELRAAAPSRAASTGTASDRRADADGCAARPGRTSSCTWPPDGRRASPRPRSPHPVRPRAVRGSRSTRPARSARRSWCASLDRDRGVLGRVVHARVDAVELVQALRRCGPRTTRRSSRRSRGRRCHGHRLRRIGHRHSSGHFDQPESTIPPLGIKGRSAEVLCVSAGPRRLSRAEPRVVCRPGRSRRRTRRSRRCARRWGS